MRWFKLSAIPAAYLMVLSSCGEDKPDKGTAVLQDIAEFSSQTSAAAHFGIYRENAPDVLLTAPGAHIDESRVKQGESLLITYIPESGQANRSGEISLLSYHAINNSSMTTGDIADFPAWDRDQVYLISIWRAGEKIDMRCRLTYDTTPRRFMLMLDQSTASNDIPDLYVVHELSQPVESFDRNYYAAFDIREIWSQPSCRGVTVHIANSNLPQRRFTFMK